MAKTFFVSTSGDDANPGTQAKPFRTIQAGVDALCGAGDVLNVRKGTYVESVEVKCKFGDAGGAGHEIRIQSFKKERVLIDAGHDDDDVNAARFRDTPNQEWELADPTIGEYVSAKNFSLTLGPDGEPNNPLNRGAFLHLKPYTRLIRYWRLEDLRAQNQKFGALLEGEGPPGPFVVDRCGRFILKGGKRVTRPWVYMGPGIFHDADDQRIHIRLSHTSNDIDGLADYNGESNPNRVGLALSRAANTALSVHDCSHVTFKNLTVRFGVETVKVRRCADVRFDHVRVFAGGKAVEMGEQGKDGSANTVFSHCEFLGGIPTWFFRSDQKDDYWFKFAQGDTAVHNGLGQGTSRILFAGSSGPSGNVNTIVHNCEFVDGLDLQLFGQGFQFHHNWVHNMQDEALILDRGDTGDLEVSQNVITQCLTAISVAGSQLGGQRVIHHNLIDLRSPIAGRRPQPDGIEELLTFRWGQFYKANATEGPIDLFHNTCLVRHNEGHASFQHYESTTEGGTRRSFNNIFVDVDPRPVVQKRATAFLPLLPNFEGPTDGNCFFQVGSFFEQGIPSKTGILWHQKCSDTEPVIPLTFYEDLGSLRGDPPATPPSDYFTSSMAVYPPGYEKNSIDVDPSFRRFHGAGDPQPDDDLRLGKNSQARKAGVELAALDPPLDDPLAPAGGKPDMGCFPIDGARLRVGVEGRRQFPKP